MKNGKYELIVAPTRYPGKRYRGRYAYEHQVVWWENTGEVIEESFAIHHKNDNKRDNRFENLQKFSKEEHSRLHAPSKEIVIVVCAYCKNNFEKSARVMKAAKKKGQKDFYCGRVCMAKHFGRGRSKFIPR